MIVVKISISTSKYFNTQTEVAQFLGVKNGSKKSLTTRCERLGFKIEFEEK